MTSDQPLPPYAIRVSVCMASYRGAPYIAEQLQSGMSVDVAARLASRTFQGLETLQLEVRDVAPAGHLAALRRPDRTASEAAA